MKITVDDIMSVDPPNNYSQECLEALFAGREFLSPEEIWALNIPYEDRWWIIYSVLLNDEKTIRLAVCDIAEKLALPVWEARYPHNKRPREAIEIARRYAHDNDLKDELHAAWYAACGAAGCIGLEVATLERLDYQLVELNPVSVVVSIEKCKDKGDS